MEEKRREKKERTRHPEERKRAYRRNFQGTEASKPVCVSYARACSCMCTCVRASSQGLSLFLSAPIRRNDVVSCRSRLVQEEGNPKPRTTALPAFTRSLMLSLTYRCRAWHATTYVEHLGRVTRDSLSGPAEASADGVTIAIRRKPRFTDRHE